MVNPDGTFDIGETKPLIEELLRWFKEKNLTWIQAVVLMKRTKQYMSDNFKAVNAMLPEKIDIEKCDIIQIELYCPAKELHIEECFNKEISDHPLCDFEKCLKCNIKIIKYMS